MADRVGRLAIGLVVILIGIALMAAIAQERCRASAIR